MKIFFTRSSIINEQSTPVGCCSIFLFGLMLLSSGTDVFGSSPKKGICPTLLGQQSLLSEKSQATPGTIIEIIQPKKWMFPDQEGCTFMDDAGQVFNGYGVAKPGTQFEIIHGPKRVGEIAGMSVKAKHVESGKIGFFYWSEIKGRSKVIQTSQVTQPSADAKLSFPKLSNKFQPNLYAHDSSLGYHGRKLPKEGDIVYLGTNRILTPSVVGKVIRIYPDPNAAQGTQPQLLVEVETLEGEKKENGLLYSAVLTDKEVSEVKLFYGSKIKVSWF